MKFLCFTALISSTFVSALSLPSEVDLNLFDVSQIAPLSSKDWLNSDDQAAILKQIEKLAPQPDDSHSEL